jgi:hypothetical protein
VRVAVQKKAAPEGGLLVALAASLREPSRLVKDGKGEYAAVRGAPADCISINELDIDGLSDSEESDLPLGPLRNFGSDI